MKNFIWVLTLTAISGVCSVWAEMAPVNVSTAPAESSGTPSVAASTTPVVVSTAPPRGMTEPEKNIFVTLTRGAYPADALPTVADVVTPQRFEKFDAQNLGDAVSRQTSLRTQPIGGVGSPIQALLRGGEPLILVDGRPVAGISLGTPDLSEIPVENIDHIEILRDGASALYGPNAEDGVINVITKRATYAGRPISNVGTEDASYGRQNYRLNFGSRYGPVDYFFYGNQQWESGFRENSDARTHNIGGNAGLSMGAAGKLLFDASSYHNDANVPGQLIPTFPANQFNNSLEIQAPTPTAHTTTETDYLRTSYIVPLPANSLMTLRLFGSQREVTFDDSTDPSPSHVVSTDRLEYSHGGEAQFNLPMDLTVGGSFIYDREANEDLRMSTHSFVASMKNWGVFAQEEFHWDRFTLIPSGRYDRNSQEGDTKNPRVQASVDATDWLRFSGSAGRSFRTPTLDDLFLQRGGVLPFTGNPNLRPETAWTYDGGFELHEDSISFKATYFRANITNLIQVAPITFDSVANIGTARRQGAEIQLDHTVNRYFKDAWNYTYLENLGIPSGFDHLVTLSFSPRHTVNYIATITPAKRWRLDATARYEDSRFSGNDQTGDKLGSQLICDLRLAYQLRQMEVYFGTDDIANKRYQEQPGFPLPGRTFYGGISLRLWD